MKVYVKTKKVTEADENNGNDATNQITNTADKNTAQTSQAQPGNTKANQAKSQFDTLNAQIVTLEQRVAELYKEIALKRVQLTSIAKTLDTPVMTADSVYVEYAFSKRLNEMTSAPSRVSAFNTILHSAIEKAKASYTPAKDELKTHSKNIHIEISKYERDLSGKNHWPELKELIFKKLSTGKFSSKFTKNEIDKILAQLEQLLMKSSMFKFIFGTEK